MRSSVRLLFNLLIIVLWVILDTVLALATPSDISQQAQVRTEEERFLGALEFGPDLVNNRLGLRLAGNSRWYAPNDILGLRLDAGLV